jgi:hypothetical protein
MRTVPAVKNDDGSQSAAETPWPPADAIAIICDGSTFTVYQPGDIVPAPPSD